MRPWGMTPVAASLHFAFAFRAGVACSVARCATVREEVEGATRWLIARHDDGHAWRAMALVVPGKRKWRDRVVDAFDALRVPHRLLIGHPGASPERFDDGVDDVVQALSLYAADTLTVPIVAIVGLGDLPWKRQALDEAVRAVVGARDAARSQVRLSFSKRSPLVDALIDQRLDETPDETRDD